MQQSRKVILNDGILASILLLLLSISIVGLLYCLAGLVFGFTRIAPLDLLLYSGWFGISILAVYEMQRGYAEGAYRLGIATIMVTLFDLLRGKADTGGALLGLIILLIVLIYLRFYTHNYAEIDD